MWRGVRMGDDDARWWWWPGVRTTVACAYLQELLDVGGGEGWVAAQHLDEQGPERPPVHLEGVADLGLHVADCLRGEVPAHTFIPWAGAGAGAADACQGLFLATKP